ncbi:MAG: NfeD family protein [Vitreoscilla sp.]|nr:NfeD family protein [Burkholderiales bacterium]MBP6338259.1 NfeD family protein [Vitreoscilla sp.]
MDWNASTLWWLTAGALVLAELVTGTFYLLMLALGAAAAALAAAAGGGFTAQLLAAALVGGGAVVGWHRRRGASSNGTETASNRNVNLDVGERVQVAAWGADGRTQVQYRGSNWAAVFRGIGAPAPGEYLIIAVESNHLVLAPHAG